MTMVFSLPSLPSFQSVRSLLDTEPQVLYPASATNHSRPPPSPAKAPTNAAGRVLPPIPNDWDRDRERGRAQSRGRRQSVASSSGSRAGPSESNGLGLHFNVPSNGAGLTPGYGMAGQVQGQARPTHRRSQSAVPAAVTPQPLGRLTEYSRNPLASTSATSLPTLVENETDSPARPGIGEGHTRTRRSSRASIYSQHSQYSHSQCSPYSQGISLPSSPLRPAVVISQSVPLPLDLAVPPPPRARNQLLTRPPPTPRAWSSVDVRSRISPPSLAETPIPELEMNGRKNLTRHASYQGHGKGKGSVSQVSDVAVLATWSFPDTDSPASSSSDRGRPVLERGVSNLAERLKSLSILQTDLASGPQQQANPAGHTPRRPSNASLAPHPSPGFGPTALSSTPRNAGHPRIVHRSSHSSPNILNAARKGLRQPVPLGSVAHSYLNRSNSNAHLGSSPGSLLSSSDTTDTSSPTSSLHSLPGQPPPIVDNTGGRGGLGGWRMPWSRRNSMANDSSTRLGLKNEEDMRERSFEGDESDV